MSVKSKCKTVKILEQMVIRNTNKIKVRSWYNGTLTSYK